MINKKYELLKNKNILYVEDDLTVQENILDTLKNFFNSVTIASDGDEAYTLYIENQNKIDLIITDINMPNTDGITLVKYIREYNKKIPIIIISAYTDTDYLLDSIELNIVKYITKPFTTQKIISLLDKLLDIFNLSSKITISKDIILSCEENILIIDKESIKLTKKESIFLKLLSENRVVTYSMMYDYMWDYDKTPSSDAIKSFIRKIKKKLPKGFIKNKQNVGYFIEAD